MQLQLRQSRPARAAATTDLLRDGRPAADPARPADLLLSLENEPSKTDARQHLRQ